MRRTIRLDPAEALQLLAQLERMSRFQDVERRLGGTLRSEFSGIASHTPTTSVGEHVTAAVGFLGPVGEDPPADIAAAARALGQTVSTRIGRTEFSRASVDRDRMVDAWSDDVAGLSDGRTAVDDVDALVVRASALAANRPPGSRAPRARNRVDQHGRRRTRAM